MKLEIMAKIALADNISFDIKSSTTKYIDKQFAGDTTKLKEMSKTVRDLTKRRER